MLKKTIVYTDYNGKSVTEDFYFNLTKAELIELELSEKNGLAQMMHEIVASEDGQRIVETFKKIILLAYGKKSDDGRRFIKSQELRDEFSQTEAYSELFIELATDAEAAAIFVQGLVPTVDVPQNTTQALAPVSVLEAPAPIKAGPMKAPTEPPVAKKTREELLAELAALNEDES